MTEEQIDILHIGDSEIMCHIRYGGPRRTRMAIAVRENGRVEVLLPAWAAAGDVRKMLIERAGWIAEHVRRAEKRRVLPDGTAGFFLGEPYCLDILTSRAWEGVRFARSDNPDRPNRLVISARSERSVPRLVKRWFEEQAQIIFTERLSVLVPGIPWLHELPAWRVRTMRSRWGSCSGRGKLTLNAKLVQAPIRCIDFVILHEIAHLRQMNHSPAFYAELSALASDWRECREELKKYSLQE